MQNFPSSAAEHLPAILHVVDTLETGGLERVVSDLAIAQHARGHDTAVFSLLATDGFRRELEAAGVPVIIGNKQGTLDRKLLGHLRQTLADRSVDILHTHNFVPNYYAAIASLALRRAPLLVNTCHNMGSRLAQRRLRWLYRASLLRTARVALVGDQVRDHLVRTGIVSATRAATVINGIPVERFGSSPVRRQAARARLGLVDADLVIGCVGRLVALKNHAQLIGLMPALLQRHPRLKLILIGDGPLAAELTTQVVTLGVGDRVSLAGAQSDIASLLPALDVFAQPSLTEGISIALLEASASGLAMVASDVGGNAEIIRNNETGLLVPVANDAALLTALDRLLADADLRQRLGSAASDWVRAHASIEVMSDAYEAFYCDARNSRK
ncbi:MAG: glycosyltransferase [Dokdonella sp.]